MPVVLLMKYSKSELWNPTVTKEWLTLTYKDCSGSWGSVSYKAQAIVPHPSVTVISCHASFSFLSKTSLLLRKYNITFNYSESDCWYQIGGETPAWVSISWRKKSLLVTCAQMFYEECMKETVKWCWHDFHFVGMTNMKQELLGLSSR